MVKRLALLILVLALLVVSRGAAAQGGSTISYGQTVTGKITNDNSRVIFTFQGHKGDVIDVSLNRTDGTLDPVLILADAQNNLIAMNDETDADASAAIVSEQLPADGPYFLIVTRFGQGIGYTTGSFSLTLSHAGVAAGSSQTLSYGDSIVGEISSAQYQQIYTFHAARGDIISAKMQRISGDLDSYLILADSTGTILTVNDDDPSSPGTLDAAITDLRIERTGNYVLVATRFGREAGDSHGGFSLSLDRLPPEVLGTVPEKAILMDYGVNVNGSVDGNHVMTFYLIEAHKGDVLTIISQRTRGNLDPILVLYTNDLKELAENDSGVRGQSARISAFVVPADNRYLLMVSRFNRDKGITSGSYFVSIIGRPGARVGAGGKLTLQYGGAVSAIISDSSAEQQYTFTAKAGDIISVSMDVTSGNLLPTLILLDPSGKQVVMDDPGTGSAKLAKFKLGAGNYVIVATRRGRDKGNTQGSYALILTLENPR